MIRAHTDGAVRVISLDRAERRNALTPDMLNQFVRAFDDLDGALAVLVRGEGKSFCAGFDLDLCKDSPDGSQMRALLSGLAAGIQKMRACGRPVVLAAHGAAVAGGCAMLGGADVVVSDERAKLGYPVVRLGVSPAVSAPYLAERVTDGSARAWLLEPVLHTGAEARAKGLVDMLCSQREDVDAEAMALARTLASKPEGAIASTRSWIDEVAPRARDWGQRALEASLALAGGAEEAAHLARVWAAN